MINGRSLQTNTTRLMPTNSNKTLLTGPSLEFRWSTAAVNRIPLVTKRPLTPLPSIVNADSRRGLHRSDGNSSEHVSTISSSLSTYRQWDQPPYSPRRRRLSRTKKQPRLLPMYSPADRSSTPFRPVILTYSQLRRPEQHQNNRRLPQDHASTDKSSTISAATSKVSLSSNPSVTSTMLPSIIEELRIPVTHPVRLQTPQLRRLHISEKYINEAKELYFDATAKVFLPRMPTMNVS